MVAHNTLARKHNRVASSPVQAGRQEQQSYEGYNLRDLYDHLRFLRGRRAKLENDFCRAAVESGAKEETARVKVITARKVPQTNELMRIIREAHLAVLAVEKVIDEKKSRDSATVHSERVPAVSNTDCCICPHRCA